MVHRTPQTIISQAALPQQERSRFAFENHGALTAVKTLTDIDFERFDTPAIWLAVGQNVDFFAGGGSVDFAGSRVRAGVDGGATVVVVVPDAVSLAAPATWGFRIVPSGSS